MTFDWRRITAPSLTDFDAIVRAAFDALPPEFRTLCGNVVLHVADFADEEMLRALGIEDPFELSGLYEGVDVTTDSVTSPLALQNHVHLFRRAMLDEWTDRGDIELGALITHVLVHEIGHHFGLSDEQMHAIEKAAD